MLRPTLFTLLASLSIATVAEAQRPVYRPAAVQEKRWTARFSAGALFGVNMTLKDVGTLGFNDAFSDGNGTTTYLFNDGVVIVPAGQTTTTRFSFIWPELEAGTDLFGNATGPSLDEFTLSRYGAVSLGAELEADDADHTGWEFSYKYEFGKSKQRIRFGIVGGLGLYNLDFSANTSVNSGLLIDSHTFSVSPSIQYDPSVPGFTGSSLGPETIDVTFLPDDFASPSDIPVTIVDPITGETIIAEVPADIAFEYSGVVAMARLGPSISVRLISQLYFEISAGVALAYQDARVTNTVSIGDALPIANLGFASSSRTTSEEHNDTLVGYYIEGLLRYQLTPRIGFHASMMQMSFDEQAPVAIGDSTYELDLSTPSIGSAGISIIF